MPLSAPVERVPLHHRKIDCRGYRRADGLWEIEGHITDVRDDDMVLRAEPRTIKAGDPIHEMWVRLTVDESLTVVAIEAAMDAVPTSICGSATAPMQSLVGLRIAPGWTNAVKERLGGPQGCTHLMELMWPIATTAYQTISASRLDRLLAPAEPGKRPVKIDSCWAYSAERELVQRLWPEYHKPAR
ncbi:MAG: DUF2889 domain-containing protein [Alphaproteobacteria bacterium]|nr:DUF2889 domain-containing protein [Alphaproteobacteria bacterium]